MNQDWGSAFLLNVNAGTAVTNNSDIVFTLLEDTAPATKLSLVTSPQNGVNIADTGTYQVTFGYSYTVAANTVFELYLNGASIGGATGGRKYAVGGQGNFAMNCTSVIVNITTNPTILSMRNTSGATRTLNTVATTNTQAPAAFMTILKLR